MSVGVANQGIAGIVSGELSTCGGTAAIGRSATRGCCATMAPSSG